MSATIPNEKTEATTPASDKQTPPQYQRDGHLLEVGEGSIAFFASGTAGAFIVLRANGEILVNGRVAANDLDVVEGMRAFLQSSGALQGSGEPPAHYRRMTEPEYGSLAYSLFVDAVCDDVERRVGKAPADNGLLHPLAYAQLRSMWDEPEFAGARAKAEAQAARIVTRR